MSALAAVVALASSLTLRTPAEIDAQMQALWEHHAHVVIVVTQCLAQLERVGVQRFLASVYGQTCIAPMQFAEVVEEVQP